MQAEEPPADTRCAFVGYRDYNCGQDRLMSCKFTADLAAFTAFLQSVRTVSHANPDFAEDVAGGLEVHPLFVYLADMHRKDAMPYKALIGSGLCDVAGIQAVVAGSYLLATRLVGRAQP